MLKRLWHWLNREFGTRKYFKGENGKALIQEGCNPPEELFEHLKKYHPKEYADLENK